MKTILVTGGAGYIGSHTLVELLGSPDYKVILIDNFCNSNPEILDRVIDIVKREDLEIYNLDCCGDLSSVFDSHHIDGVIHFAAFKSVGESVEFPLMYYRNNIDSLVNVLHYCEKYDVKGFVFSSSCSLYGNVASLPVSEKTELSVPESPYAYTKLVGERVISDFSNSVQGFKSISLRYFNPVGAHPSSLIGELPLNKPNNILPVICRAAGGGGGMTIFGDDYETRDGTCVRDYVHVCDIARAHRLAIQHVFSQEGGVHEVFNLGSEQGYSVWELVRAFERVNGVKVPVSVGGRREGDIVQIYSDSSKAKEILKWSAKMGIDEIVSTAWEWHLKSGIQN